MSCNQSNNYSEMGINDGLMMDCKVGLCLVRGA
jgi:hypothetical protein